MNEILISIGVSIALIVMIYFALMRNARIWGKFPLDADEKVLYEEEGIRIMTSLRGENRQKIYFNSGFKFTNKRFFVLSGKTFILQIINFGKNGEDEILKGTFYVPKKNFMLKENEKGKNVLRIEKPFNAMMSYLFEAPVKDMHAIEHILK